MMQDSGQSSQVSVRVLICIFTFELQSESSANVFHISGDFGSISFGVYDTANI